MEVMLLWLDELDDVFSAAAFSWRSICRFGLCVGLAAAFVLSPIYGSDLRAEWAVSLSSVAAASVLAWMVAVAVPMRQSLQRVLDPA